ncbi:MAG TPA: MFS transporter [Chitinophagaceae bacterium]|nr:MFS transporter [Chitinophagaceae bacterium]
MQEKLLRLLNIRPHESALVKKLFLVQFFLVIGSAFLFVTANAIFLSAYHIIELPRAFLLSGIFILAFNWVYSKAEHRVNTRQLLNGIIIFSAVVTLLIGLGLLYTTLPWMPYVLLIWYNIVYLLTGLVFWGLAAMLFNVRESKRLFTIIGAGDIPAKLLGYLSVSMLAPYIGLGNMLWIAVASFIIALFFGSRIFNTPQVTALQSGPRQHTAPPAVGRPSRRIRLFGSDLILYTAGLSLMTFLALLLIDFTFLAEVKVKYHTDVELAYFLGIFFAAGRILAVLLKITLSSRLINRIGLAGALLLSPVLLLLFTVAILFIARAGVGFQSFIYLFGMMALFTEILKAIIQEPVFLVLFQPLKLPLRLRGHVIAKGYMLGIAMIVTGGLLVLYLARVQQPSIRLFSYVLAGILLLWIAIVFLVKKQYLVTLHDALKSGFFRGNELFLNDKAITGLLKKKTESKKPAEVIYALNLLEKSGYETIDALLTLQLKKDNATIRQYALTRITERKYAPALEAIEAVLSTSGDSSIRAQCIGAVSLLCADSRDKLQPYLDAADMHCKRAAIIGLLRSGDLEGLLLAGNRLLEFIYSPKATERIMGAEIIGATGEKGFYRTLIKLMGDQNIGVQKKAIGSAGKIFHESLLPPLTEKLKQHETVREATLALTHYGDPALAFYKKTIANEALLAPFIRIAGGINTPLAESFLTEKLFGDSANRTLVIDKLWEKKYRAASAAKKQLLHLVHTELDHARKIIYYENGLGLSAHYATLKKALGSELDIRVANTFKLLSFIYDSHKINGAMNVLILKGNQKASNALEMLEMIIPRDIFRKITFLVETTRQQGYKVKKKDKERNLQDILKEIIQPKMYFFNNWTKAVAVSLIGQLNDPALLAYIRQLRFPASAFIIEETRLYVLSNVKQP